MDLSRISFKDKHEIDYVLQLAASLCLRYLVQKLHLNLHSI